MEQAHLGILRKFQFLTGDLLVGKGKIKGINSTKRLPPDEFVSEPYILHDLIRGFYKPAGKPYLLSYQATESEENYGKQIVWDEEGFSFLKIEMHPPKGEKDKRKKSDIEAARYNLLNKIPIGILHKIKKGHNRVLGLGIIVQESDNGVFLVEPFKYQHELQIETNIELIVNLLDNGDIDTNTLQEVIQRRGQDKFKNKLLLFSQECAICGIINSSLLIASHIKPWKVSSHKERMDPMNGLLLCPNHDKLFDKGYITFADDGGILISPILSNNTMQRMQITTNISIKIHQGAREYLKWHRKVCFIRKSESRAK